MLISTQFLESQCSIISNLRLKPNVHSWILKYQTIALSTYCIVIEMEKLHIHRKTHNTKRTWIIGTEVQSSHDTFVGGSESLRLVVASFLVKFKSTKKEEQSRCWNGWAKGCGYHQDKIIMNKDKVQAPSANIIKKNSLVECQVDRSPNLKILECIHAITYCNLGLFKLGT
jgi:hypothetical protein